MLTVDGNASKSAGGISWAVFSDERLNNIEGNYNRGLEEIIELQPVYFRYKEDNSKGLQSEVQNIGLIAQEVQKVIPEDVDDSNNYLSLQSDPILWAMLNSIKELKAENDALKMENKSVKSTLLKMDERIKNIQQMLIMQTANAKD